MSSKKTYKKFNLKKQFEGLLSEDNFELVEEDLPSVGDGDYLLESLYLSVDPYMRLYAKSWLKEGQKMMGTGVGRVIDSRNTHYPIGTIVVENFGWSTHLKISKDEKKSAFHWKHSPDVSPSHALGIYSLTGLTAYFGLLEVCQPKSGETVFVNAAAGATGSTVGQIAKLKGCKVVGCAGSDEKVKYLKEIGFDGAFNYKTADLKTVLKELCPNGIDCFFDNVGGDLFEAALKVMNKYGRIAICGSIGVYNEKDLDTVKGPLIHIDVLSKELRIQGFMVGSYVDKYDHAVKDIMSWVKEGKIQVREHVVDGFENMPKALIGLFSGNNIGKCVVKM